MSRLSTADNGRISFVAMIEEKPEKIFVIYNFLAILELLQLSKVTIQIGEGFNNFWVEKTSPEEVPEA
jgi:segregation and condensation protein A